MRETKGDGDMENQAAAERIFNSWQRDKTEKGKTYPLGHIANATVEQIAAQMDLIDALNEEFKLTAPHDLNINQCFGQSEEQLRESARKIKVSNKSRGARALQSKYGKETAEWIIAKKTGKHINLR